MNREDIIRMAKEAHKDLVTLDYPGHAGQLDPWTLRLLERFAALVAAADDRPRRRRSPLRRDAERYRWLRGMIYDDRIIVAADRMLHGEALDAAVDAAMRQEQPR